MRVCWGVGCLECVCLCLCATASNSLTLSVSLSVSICLSVSLSVCNPPPLSLSLSRHACAFVACFSQIRANTCMPCTSIHICACVLFAFSVLINKTNGRRLKPSLELGHPWKSHSARAVHVQLVLPTRHCAGAHSGEIQDKSLSSHSQSW